MKFKKIIPWTVLSQALLFHPSWSFQAPANVVAGSIGGGGGVDSTRGGGTHSTINTVIHLSSSAAPATSVSNDDDETDKLPPLPPGRGKWPILGDTLQILNPKTMGSYQVEAQRKFGSSIWKTSFLFMPTVFVAGVDNMEELTKEEARKRTTAHFPPHHQKLFGPQSLLVTSGEAHSRLRRLIQPALSNPEVYRSYM
jgi:hypothetical protein